MKRPQLLFVCWCSSIVAVTSCIRADGYSCVSAYWDTVTCVLNITGNSVGQSNITSSLTFTESMVNGTFSCPLVLMNHSYSCVCKVTRDKLYTLSVYDIDLCNTFDCHRLVESFKPSKNIQMTPPHKAEVHQTPEAFNITWKSGYEKHDYLASFVRYQLLLQTFQSSESKTSHLESDEKFVSILRLHPKAYAKYCIKVRSKPIRYTGTWSKWSPLTCWENEAQKEQETILVILTKSLAPVCVVVGVFLFVFYSPATRERIKTLSRTPSPAPFFQPLFQQHKGNLQGWLSPQGKFAFTYKTEEIVITDAVTVVAKPVTKDPEENPDFHSTSPPLIQCQTSYVGLPVMHEAPPPVTMPCPGNTSYTQLPCSILGFDTGEVQVVPSALCPKDFLEIDSADSGYNCERLPESPECSLSNSSVDDSSPPCHSNDYCRLNKTAEGVFPVLVSTGCSPYVPFDFQQWDDRYK